MQNKRKLFGDRLTKWRRMSWPFESNEQKVYIMKVEKGSGEGATHLIIEISELTTLHALLK